MRILLLLLPITSLAAGRVVYLSLDGFGYQRWIENDVVRELPSLQRLARRGEHAQGVIAHFPSTTSNSHAALYTGVHGDRNGIAANENARSPRGEYTFLDRITGFRSESLRSMPIWASAALEGIPVVAHQVTQAFPFQGLTIGEGKARDLVLVNGYQTRRHAQGKVLRAADTEADDSPLPAGVPNGRRIQWTAGPLRFHASLTPAAAYFWADGTAPVRAPLHSAENVPPRGRKIARHFSPSLYLKQFEAGVFFRFFEFSAADFLIYHTPVQELGLYGASGVVAELIRACGGFHGNSATRDYEDGRFGTLFAGGLAARRFLETVELNARQSACHAEWLWNRFHPSLFVDYFNQPDDLDHTLLGFGAKAIEWRRWGYQAIEFRLSRLLELLDARDHIFITSDHGMTATRYRLNVNAALRDAGLEDRATCLQGGVLLNTVDWKGGVIQPSARPEVIALVRAALSKLKDPATGEPIIAAFYDPAVDGGRFGIGGVNGADLYFDAIPGYYATCGKADSAITAEKFPRGNHGMTHLLQSARQFARK